MNSQFDEDLERARFIEKYELAGLIEYNGKYWIPLKPDPLLQGTVMVMYQTWIDRARLQ